MPQVPKVAACLITKNSAETILPAIESIRRYVDEINVYDTGSTDDTVTILEALNGQLAPRACKTCGKDEGEGTCEECDLVDVYLAPIRVERGTWRGVEYDGPDDPLMDWAFAWAREQSLKMCSEDMTWFLWLDDDDTIIGAHRLRDMIYQAPDSLDGYLMFYDYARDDAGNGNCELWRERLCRLHREGWSWVNPVHEIWMPTPGTNVQANYMVTPPDTVRYVHRRPVDRYPMNRNLEILQRLVERQEARGDEVELRTIAYLGTELMSQAKYEEAVKHFIAYLDDPRSDVSDERSQIRHKLSMCLRALGRPMAAIEPEFGGIKERDGWAEHAIGLCEAFAALEDWQRCKHWALQALEIGAPNTTLIVNPLEFTFLPKMRLAQACAALGEWDEANRWIAEAAQIAPTHDLLRAMGPAIAHDAKIAELVQTVLSLREVLIRFDENDKAWKLMQAVPYLVADHPQIVAAKAMTRENVMHMLKPEEYVRWYADEPKESIVPDEWIPTAADVFPRVRFTLDLLKQIRSEGHEPRALDLGCNDFWLGAFLWSEHGFVMDGIELNKAAYKKGVERAKRFGVPAQLVRDDLHNAARHFKRKYDVVTMYEVLEHVPDMDATLAAIEKLVAPGGYVCLTTPNGAFDDGNIPFWSKVERKGHLRALPASDFLGLLKARGKITDFKIHTDDRLSWAAYRPGKRRGKVALYGGPSWEPWGPESIQTTGLGGSETALTVLAMGLAEREFDVTVYVDATPGMYGGALFKPAGAFDPTEERDAVIVSRAAAAFGVEIHAPFRALWCHDHSYLIEPEWAERITHMAVLSEWQRDRFELQHPALADRLHILRNGVMLDRFDPSKTFSERKPKAIYSSSADRGLDALLRMWPKIRAQVPDAELHVFYGWDIFDRVALHQPRLLDFKAAVYKLYEDAGGEDGGVFFRGRIGQQQMYEEMAEARVWSYPSYFLETSCIGAMEARCSGLVPVTSNLAALRETIGHEHGVLIDPKPTDDPDVVELDEDYAGMFIQRVVQNLKVEEVWNANHALALNGVEELAWDLQIDKWAELIAPTRKPQRPRARARA